MRLDPLHFIKQNADGRPGDGSLCLRVVVEKMIRAEEGQVVELDKGETASSIERRVRDFVTMNARLQQLPNRSGDISSGGLGEPKFNVDGSAFNASWGRPQNVRLVSMASDD